MILSASNIAWAPTERHKAYEILVKNHFSGLEIAPSLFFWKSQDSFNPSNKEKMQALSELKSHGLKLVSMQSILFGLDDAKIFGDKTQFQKFLEGMKAAIFLAGELNISNVVFGCPKNRNVPANIEANKANDIAISLFNMLGNFAKEAGTLISIEPNPQIYGTNFLNTQNETEKFITLVNHPAIVPMLDTGALEESGELYDIPKSIRRLRHYLNHIHISELYLKPAALDKNKLIKIIETLKENQYSKAISVEMKRTVTPLEDLDLSLKMLYSLVNNHYG